MRRNLGRSARVKYFWRACVPGKENYKNIYKTCGHICFSLFLPMNETCSLAGHWACWLRASGVCLMRFGYWSTWGTVKVVG